MKLRFGAHLDGQHGRPPANQLGVLDVGPLGLLSVLEAQLGLVPPRSSSSQRVIQYRDCLKKLDQPSRFYHRSLEVDDFGTAATLLDWRDDWLIHGWTGKPPGKALARLQDMADVEDLASGQVAPGMAERLNAVAGALAGKRTLIESIALIDSPDAFAPLWRRVLEKLPCTLPQTGTVLGKGLLAEIQRAILAPDATTRRERLAWRDDGTVFVARAETAVLGARWIAETLRRAAPDVLYVANSEAAATDLYLGAADYPRQGLSETSAFRPALQLLPLTLELLWKPLNFHALIQFLTHPIAPIPIGARRRLASVQAEHPGVGGPRWNAAITEIEEAYADKNALRIRELIDYWIDHPRFATASGAPVATVLERTQRLCEFFRNSPGDATPALRHAHAAGLGQCLGFAENLGRLLEQGVETLRPRQLEQLVRQSTARGNDNPLRIAEAGALPCISHPGATLGQHAVVLWGPLDAPALPASWPWSKSEISALREVGCLLPDTGALLQQTASEWLRPLLAATDRLILLLPPHDRESHPVWQMLDSLIRDLPVHTVEDLLLKETATLTRVAHTPLPGIKRWWELPPGTRLPEVDEYSFSQLEKQLFNPYQWLVTYAAKLNSGSLLSLADDFRLKGILAHSLVERLYAEDGGLGMTDTAFAAWFDPAFNRLIAEEGALYLMPGRGIDLENLRRSLRRALGELRAVLKRSGVKAINAECEFKGHFVGGKLGGTSDLVLTRPDGAQAIIDMKWGGKTHRAKLENNRHLQLAIYAELLRQKTGNWPAVGNFLLSEARLLFLDDLWFPGLTALQNRTGENTAQLWLRFVETWKWRQEQFAAGRFEVVLEKDDDSQAPEDGLEIDVLNQRYNEALHLAGWGAQA